MKLRPLDEGPVSFIIFLCFFFFLFFLSFISQLFCFLSSLPTLASSQRSLHRLSLLIAISFAYNNRPLLLPNPFPLSSTRSFAKILRDQRAVLLVLAPFLSDFSFERILARRYRFRYVRWTSVRFAPKYVCTNRFTTLRYKSAGAPSRLSFSLSHSHSSSLSRILSLSFFLCLSLALNDRNARPARASYLNLITNARLL